MLHVVCLLLWQIIKSNYRDFRYLSESNPKGTMPTLSSKTLSVDSAWVWVRDVLIFKVKYNTRFHNLIKKIVFQIIVQNMHLKIKILLFKSANIFCFFVLTNL